MTTNTPTPSTLAAKIKRLADEYATSWHHGQHGSADEWKAQMHDAIDRLAALASAAHGEPVDAVKELKLAADHASMFPRRTMVVPLDEALGFVAQSGEPVAEVRTMKAGGNVGIATHIVALSDELQSGDLLYTRPAAPAEPADLRAFLDAAAGEGLVLAGVDAADLCVSLFPEHSAALQANDTTKGQTE